MSHKNANDVRKWTAYTCFAETIEILFYVWYNVSVIKMAKKTY